MSRGFKPCAPGGGAPVAGKTPGGGEHTLKIRAVTAGDPQRFIAVLSGDTFGFRGYNIQCFVPADTHPLVTSAQRFVPAARCPVFAFHRVFQAIGPEHLFTLGTPAQTPALLREVRGIRHHIISFLSDHHTIGHQCFVNTAPAAVMPAGDRFPLPFGGRRCRRGGLCRCRGGRVKLSA